MFTQAYFSDVLPPSVLKPAFKELWGGFDLWFEQKSIHIFLYFLFVHKIAARQSVSATLKNSTVCILLPLVWGFASQLAVGTLQKEGPLPKKKF